jgi:hypothetical protein
MEGLVHKTRIGLRLGLAVIALLTLATTALAATTTVVVRPSSLNGWIVDTTVLGNPPVPTSFNGPSDSAGGDGSFRFGPIGAPNQAKLEMQPPEVLVPTADFDSFKYEYDVITSVAGNSANHFYANVYIDSAANGINTFTNGFYDCRMSFVAALDVAPWNSFSFNDTTSPTATGGALCTANIGSSASGSLIRFFRLSGGDTSANDNGLEGAYDLVALTIAGNTTVYDFEPDIPQPATKDDCKNGGWASLAKPGNVPFKNQGDCIQYVNTGK